MFKGYSINLQRLAKKVAKSSSSKAVLTPVNFIVDILDTLILLFSSTVGVFTNLPIVRLRRLGSFIFSSIDVMFSLE
jgi:hypothetical protein